MAYDLRNPEFLADPTPMIAQMRNEGPLVKVRLPILGKVWMTTTDQAARDLLKASDQFVRDNKGNGKPLAQRYWWMPRTLRPLLSNLLAFDGAEHKRLRDLVSLAFSRSEIDDMRPRLAAIADDLLDQIDTSKPVDVLTHYARPLPLIAICELLGIPQADRPQIIKWIAPISGVSGVVTILRSLPGLRKLMLYFREDFRTLRDTPRPGLISDLVHAESNGDRLTEDELLAMVVTLFIAGTETTVHLIANSIYGVVSNPNAHDAMLDAERLPLLVEEFMRFTSPVMLTKPMFVTHDLKFQGVQLKKDEAVTALLIAANRDGARFEKPDTFEAHRQPNPHLGFGHGPHVCLGMQLARAECHTALARLFERFPQARLAQDAWEPSYIRRIGMHGLSTLPLRLRP